MDRETIIAQLFNRHVPNPHVTFRATTGEPVITAAGTRYPVALAPINVPSDDGRVIVASLGWREPPLPFFASDSEMGHGDAIHVGTLTDFETVERDGDEWVMAALEYDDDADATEFERLANDQGFRFVSIHMGTARWAPVIQNDDGTWEELTRDNIDEMIDERGAEIMDNVYDGFFDAEIGAATQVGIPAFPGASIDVDNGTPTADDASDDDDNDETEMAVVVAATFDTDADLRTPPAEWFTNPELDGPTGVTVDDDGRVFGHLALWNSCHTGYRGQCVRVPDNPDYSLFLQCNVTTDDGDIRVGPLVVDEGHAPIEWSVPRAMTHYSSTALVAAYVTVGHDEHGVWVAGAVSPNATDTMVETLRRHPLSGDWRHNDDGEYQLVAAVSVNAPGFAVRPRVMVAAGADDPTGLVTYGPAPVDEIDQSTMSLLASAVDRMVDVMGAVAMDVAELRARIDTPPVELSTTVDDDRDNTPDIDDINIGEIANRFGVETMDTNPDTPPAPDVTSTSIANIMERFATDD